MDSLKRGGGQDYGPGRRGEVLVAIMNNLTDFNIAHDQHWYRIPVHAVNSMLKDRWPPAWLAFYQTKVFGPDRWAINYYAPVRRTQVVSRRELFPDDPSHNRANVMYHKIEIEPLQRLLRPIVSARWRRIVFISTTWHKFLSAVEINDLFDESPLEDTLWEELKRHDIAAERQLFVPVKENLYSLDFAIFCVRGDLDVETDGDTWHANRERIPLDNQRDNELTGAGWSVLRFNGKQIREGVTDHCIPQVMETINTLGGLSSKGLIPRKFDPRHPEAPRQLALFESSADYDAESW